MRRKSVPNRAEYPDPPPSPSMKKHHSGPDSTDTSIPTEEDRPGFADLPYDVLVKIAGSFGLLNLRNATLVCRAWRDALKPLHEAMALLRRGRRFMQGDEGEEPNLSRALDSFLEGAARGSTLAVLDAGRTYWEMGDKEEAAIWYRKAAELGNAAGQFNLAISILQGNPKISNEAIELLYKASNAGHVRAQYQLAHCFHQGRGVTRCPKQAARWYQKAAEGGHVRSMYNTSLCYLLGEGFSKSLNLAREWMKTAAEFGHTIAQFEHGLALYSQGDLTKALVYLELATRGGQTSATRLKNTILQQLPETSRAKAMLLADRWRALPSSW